MEDRQTGRRVTTSSGRSTAVSAAWSHPRARLRGGPGWSVRPSSGPPALPLCQPPRRLPSLHAAAAAWADPWRAVLLVRYRGSRARWSGGVTGLPSSPAPGRRRAGRGRSRG